MHGFYRLNIIRAFSITSLLLVAGSAVLVVVSNALSTGVFLAFLVFHAV